jgi:hypothetical protein
LALAAVLFLLLLLLKGISGRRESVTTARWIRIALTAGLLVVAAGCGSSKNAIPTMGTPAGTTTVMINATSGNVMQSTSIALTVK